MKRSTRTFIGISLALLLGSMGTCYFGVRYAENQIPTDVRAQMTDTDWVGSEWITRGMCLFLLGFSSWSVTAFA